jgi:hypothetical protein
MACKHFQRELMAEFPVKNRRCPKCSKLFDNNALYTVSRYSISSIKDAPTV